MLPAPVTEVEFQAAIYAIDNELRDMDISIDSRSFHAIMIYAKRFDMDIPIPAASLPGTVGDYKGQSVGAHILHWYGERYGDRQYFYMGPGSVMIMLRNDPWEMRLPLILGEVHYVVERELNRYSDSPRVTQDGVPPIVNILTSVCELPVGLAKSLSEAECETIVERFTMGMECLRAINGMENFPYIPESLSDIASAVRHVFSVPSHFGQSKWSSAQAAEKIIKSFLKTNKIPFPQIHDIEKLYALASPAGLGHIDKELLETLRTKASVRYGEEPVTLIEAVEAHLASLVVGRVVAQAQTIEKKIIVDLVKGFDLAADKNGGMMVARFDLGNQRKAFWIPSPMAKYLLSTAEVMDGDYSNITIPRIEAADWDGAITPMLTFLKIGNIDDLITMTMLLNRGATDGLAFNKDVWSLFIKTLRQYEQMLVP